MIYKTIVHSIGSVFFNIQMLNWLETNKHNWKSVQRDDIVMIFSKTEKTKILRIAFYVAYICHDIFFSLYLDKKFIGRIDRLFYDFFVVFIAWISDKYCLKIKTINDV